MVATILAVIVGASLGLDKSVYVTFLCYGALLDIARKLDELVQK